MKHIKKGNEPPLLIAHRKQKDANFDNIPKKTKEQLRTHLLKEQGFICCYCMQRITKENMKIEHWRPQKYYAGFQLAYKNLLASCKGGEGKRREFQHCDTKKGEKEIAISPVDQDKNCERMVKFKGDGTVYSDDAEINVELNNILNLNMETLRNNRSEVMIQAIKDMTRIKGAKTEGPIQYAKKMIEKYYDHKQRLELRNYINSDI